MGLPYQQTSYSDTGETTVVSQTQDVYNGYGQLTGEYQAASGAVNTSSTPEVQYVYSQPSGANYSRMSAMIYPNGRQLDYVYNTGVDTTISRISGISDDSGTGAGNDQSYTYLGLDTIVQETDGNGVELTYIHQSGDTLSSSAGGDRYTGLDEFGRVIDQWWYDPSTTTTLERLQYGYDRDGNTLYENNLVDSADSALYSPANGTAPNSQYDSLGRLQGFERGTLSSSGTNGTALDTVTTTSTTESWSLDALGNWSSFSTNGTAQTRSFNSENQISAISGTTTTPSFDNNGNMTEDEQGHKYVFNAWNQIVDVENTSNTVLASYSYDALGRRISNTVNSITTNLYYGASPNTTLASANVIESRQGGTVTTQFVWGLGYVNALVLRDDNTTSGSYGLSGSGLGERLYAQQNANWSVTALVSTAAGVLERFLYDPYGNAAVLSSVWTATTDSYNWLYKFQGGRQDPVSGLIRFGNQNGRYYSPTLGRFTSPDTGGGYVNGANLYQAFLGAPISKVDPTGWDTGETGSTGGSSSTDTGSTGGSASTTNPATQPGQSGWPNQWSTNLQNGISALKSAQSIVNRDFLTAVLHGNTALANSLKQTLNDIQNQINNLQNQLQGPPPPPPSNYPSPPPANNDNGPRGSGGGDIFFMASGSPPDSGSTDGEFYG
ncbi:MAG TPA: RHS repeat-associated core domain-containing protein [Tepidisphaeraceae bacterium]|nr:RHS repeat-associated core domain-containing protein [Tepidisphaeraceae bacterium]